LNGETCCNVYAPSWQSCPPQGENPWIVRSVVDDNPNPDPNESDSLCGTEVPLLIGGCTSLQVLGPCGSNRSAAGCLSRECGEGP
jgi:hypothetical protein